jgi:hypothetical protein
MSIKYIHFKFNVSTIFLSSLGSGLPDGRQVELFAAKKFQIISKKLLLITQNIIA